MANQCHVEGPCRSGYPKAPNCEVELVIVDLLIPQASKGCDCDRIRDSQKSVSNCATRSIHCQSRNGLPWSDGYCSGGCQVHVCLVPHEIHIQVVQVSDMVGVDWRHSAAAMALCCGPPLVHDGPHVLGAT